MVALALYNQMIFGYIRVSTKEQNIDRQFDELENQCDELFIDRISGRKAKRPELDKMFGKLRKGDTVKVMRIARFSRSTKDFLTLTEKLQEMEVTLVSVKEGLTFDGTPTGKLMFTLLAIIAEMEADMIRDRTKEGLRAAAKRGRVGGRPKGLSEEGKKKAKLVAKLYKDDEWSIKEIS